LDTGFLPNDGRKVALLLPNVNRREVVARPLGLIALGPMRRARFVLCTLA